jgi:geranylgeranyl pyrophosphate synthase
LYQIETTNKHDGPARARPLAEALEMTRALIQQTLDGVDPALTDIAGTWGKSSGKHIRAALLLSAQTDARGLIEPDAVHSGGGAGESFTWRPSFTDDVIDDAPTRRGLPSIQSQFGKKTRRYHGGDYLFCLCYFR